MGLLCCCFCPPPVLMSWLVMHTDITPTQLTSGALIHRVVTQDHMGVVDKGDTDTEGDDHHGIEGLLCCCFCAPPVLMSRLVLHMDITPT